MGCHVFIAASVDGYIATVDGGVEWLDEPGDARLGDGTPDDHGWPAFIAGIDALVMGRATFEKVLSFGVTWPYEVPVFVMTTSSVAVPDELSDRVELTTLAPVELVTSLRERGMNELYVDGGRVITSFVAAGLVAELTITTVPVLLGDGIPLFGTFPGPIRLGLVSSRSLSNGMVQTHYRVRRP